MVIGDHSKEGLLQLVASGGGRYNGEAISIAVLFLNLEMPACGLGWFQSRIYRWDGTPVAGGKRTKQYKVSSDLGGWMAKLRAGGAQGWIWGFRGRGGVGGIRSRI